jgi:hypothetical protein
MAMSIHFIKKNTSDNGHGGIKVQRRTRLKMRRYMG